MFWNILRLWATGKIGMRTAVYALREKPVAVAGKGGGYIIDPRFEVGG